MWLYLPACTPVAGLLPPAAISPRSQESAPSTSPLSGSFRRLNRACTWRTTRRTHSDWRRVWRKDASLRRLFGPTFARSPSSCSEAVRTWLSAAFPARISPSQASAAGSTGGGLASSFPSSAPFATYDPGTSTWKTSQLSLWDATSTPWQGRWPTSVLMRCGAAYERPTLARRMAGIAGGASPGTASNWPTPTGLDSTSTANHTASRSNQDSKHHDGVTLVDAARMWPTPQQADGERGSEAIRRKVNNPTLLGAARTNMRQWPTPSVADVTGSHMTRGGDRSMELLLPGMAQKLAEQWMTPNAQGGTGYMSGSNRDTWRPTLEGQVRGARPTLGSRVGHQVPLIEAPGPPSSPRTPGSRPQLSALFVEWLMNLPLGWTCICQDEEA